MTQLLVVLAALAAPETHMINSSGVNLRAEASLEGEIIFRLPFGTQCQTKDRKGSWVQVTIPGAEDRYVGWVYSSYVSDLTGTPSRRDNNWIELAKHPEKGLKAPLRLEDVPCEDVLDEKCVEEYRTRYYIERRNALERWIFWEDDVTFDVRGELWAILGGPYTPYDLTPPEIINASPFAQLPPRALSATHSGAKSSYRVDMHGERAKGLECSPMPEVKPSFFQELPERFGVARAQAHGGIVDFAGAPGSEELLKVLDVYFPKETPFAFQTSDRYASSKAVPIVVYDLETGALQRNAGKPVYVPSRNMFLLTELETQRPEKRHVLVFYSWIEVYLDQLLQAKKVKEVAIEIPPQKGTCAAAKLNLKAIDLDGDRVPDVVMADGEKQGSCGYRRKDTYINVDGDWRGFVNNYEEWCDTAVATPTATPTPLPFE